MSDLKIKTQTLAEWVSSKIGDHLKIIKGFDGHHVSIGLFDNHSNEMYLIGVVDTEKDLGERDEL